MSLVPFSGGGVNAKASFSDKPKAQRMLVYILDGSASKSVDQPISNFTQIIENARFVRHSHSVSRTMSPQEKFSQNSAAFSKRCRFEVISITTDFEADPG